MLPEGQFDFMIVSDQIVIRQHAVAKTTSSPLLAGSLNQGSDLNEEGEPLRATAGAAVAGSITGSVSDRRTGQPLSSVQIHIPILSRGTVSDSEGRFLIPSVPAGSYEVRADLIGYTSASLEAVVQEGAATSLDFELVETAFELNPIVASVTAGVQRRVQVGTDIESMNAERAVEVAAISTLSDLLHARAPGVTVNLPSGQVGAASTIKVRGATSLTQDNTPLIYVDGVRVSNNTEAGPISFDFGNLGSQTISRFNDINPQDIADIQVIKGPSAAALYGSEAAAGVIVITTKRGKTGGTSVQFQTEQSFTHDVADYRDAYFNLSRHGVTDVNDPRFQQWRPVQNPVTGEIFARDNPLKNEKTRPFQTGHGQSYSLSVRGGTDRLSHFTSGRYENERGTLPNNGLRRLNLRSNLDLRPSDALTVSFSNSYTESTIEVPHGDHSAFGMITNGEAGFPLYSYGVRPDGSAGDCLATVLLGTDPSVCDARQGNLTANFDKLMTPDNGEELGRFISSLSLRWVPLEWLSTRFAAGVDNINTRTWQLVPLDPDRPFGDRSKGFLTESRAADFTYSVDGAATAAIGLGNRVTSSTTLGGQFFRKEFGLTSCTGDGGFASTTAIACDAAVTFSGGSDRVESVEVGGFLQQQFGLDEVLYLNGSLRVDDNTGFGSDQGAIWSPSANVSWLVSGMEFWPLEFVSEFRLRAAWGTAAQAPSPYAHVRTFRPVRLEVDGQQLTGITPYAPGNSELTAERNEEVELGFDVGLLNERISGKFTYFRQKTRDAIISRPVAKSTGFETNQWVNLGALENEGVEAVLSAQLVATDNVLWDATFSLATQQPIVTSLGGQVPTNSIREGYAPGYLSAPVVRSAERDALGNIVPGSVQMMSPDIAGTDRRYIGPSEPTNNQSVTSTLTLFNNLRIFVLFDRAAGHYKYDGTTAYRSPFIASQHVSRLWAFRQLELTPEQQAAVEMGGAARQWVFMSKGDYIKWRELTVSYALPAMITGRLPGGVDAAQLTVGGQNLHTWTDYMGLDPQERDDGGSNSFSNAPFFTMPPGMRVFVRLDFSM